MEQRLTELESRVAFQEDTIQKLNDVLVGQQEQIDKLENELKYLNGKVKDLATELTAAEVKEEIPPHY